MLYLSLDESPSLLLDDSERPKSARASAAAEAGAEFVFLGLAPPPLPLFLGCLPRDCRLDEEDEEEEEGGIPAGAAAALAVGLPRGGAADLKSVKKIDSKSRNSIAEL